MKELTPREIVSELNRYIIGQNEAKKAVAIALRNRWRRQNIEDAELREEIVPKNILMIGPTGVGKTEISRRLSKLADAPFIKVEATKFTEIGYVGRDVESIIRDLIEIGINMVRTQKHKEVKEKAAINAEIRILDAIVGEKSGEETKAKFREKLESGSLEDTEIDIQLNDAGENGSPLFDIPGMPGGQMGVINVSEMLGKAMGKSQKTRRITVKEARPIVIDEEGDKLLDQDSIIQDAIKVVENNGIVFIDEIDKVSVGSDARGGGEVSREGVQRDLLPLLEGTTVSTKYGPIKTDHVLFIASGAFHLAKPSDLLPELQGRLPIRVELKSLTEEDMVRILTEPEASLIKQYKALMNVEKVNITFSDDAIKEIAFLAISVNREVENIGARRLHTMMEKLMEDISFDADENSGASIVIDKEYVSKHLNDLVKNTDLSKFIL